MRRRARRDAFGMKETDWWWLYAGIFFGVLACLPWEWILR